MPIIFDIDRERKQIHALADGLITYADVEAHLSEEHGVAGLKFSELIDARHAVPQLTLGDVRQIIGLLRGLNLSFRFGPTAILVQGPFALLLDIIGMLVVDFCDIRSFSDEKEARTWLGWEPQI